MTVVFRLALERGLVFLTENGNGSEALVACLSPGNLFLELSGCCIALAALGNDEAQADQVMRVRQGDKIVPVLFVEAGEGCEDEDTFTVSDGVWGVCDVVHVVVDNWRRRSLFAGLKGRLEKRERGRREGIGGGIFGFEQLSSTRDMQRWASIGRREDEDEEAKCQETGQDQRDGISTAKRSCDGHCGC